MLTYFEVSNYGPFSGAIGISTQSDMNKKEYLETNTFVDCGKRYNYVTYIYGYNGSGKSNIFKALLSMKQILTLSPIIATNNQQILENSQINYEVTGQRNFFKFKNGLNDIPTRYKIEITIDGTIYIYSFEVLDKKIVKEHLYRKNKRTELLLSRESEKFEDITVKSELKPFENFKSTVRENVLCLSMAMFLNNKLAVKIYQAIDEINVVNMASLNSVQGFEEDLTKENLETYIKFVKLADNTIKELKVSLEKEEVNKKIQLSNDFESREFVIKNLKIDVESVHNVYCNNKVVGEETLPFLQFESNGTIKLFGILPILFKTLRSGGTIFVDEIENGLHPNLTKMLISLFNSKETNPFNAQLICSSHETLLLKNNVRRDQVWFLHKNEFGESSITRLSEFPGTRITDDVAKKYLNGAFGEIPHI